MFVLHTPLFLLDVPETHRIVQAGSGKPFPASGEARSKYWALFRLVLLISWSLQSQPHFMYSAFKIQLSRSRENSQRSIIGPHRQKCPMAIPVQRCEIRISFRGRTINSLVWLEECGFVVEYLRQFP